MAVITITAEPITVGDGNIPVFTDNIVMCDRVIMNNPIKVREDNVIEDDEITTGDNFPYSFPIIF